MKFRNRMLGAALALCVVFGTSMGALADSTMPMISGKYRRPDREIGKVTSNIVLDGELEDAWRNEATTIDFSRNALKTDGLIWSYTDDDGETFASDTNDGYGTGYIGWTDEYILFALQVKDKENTNNITLDQDLWQEDCLQIQIGAGTEDFYGEDAEASRVQRYEFGFALSSQNGRGLGYMWSPTGKKLPAARVQELGAVTSKTAYYVKHSNGVTTYEVALRYTAFEHDGEFSAGEEIPFSFALHVYKDPADYLGGYDNGWFHEWGRGVIGGDSPDDMRDDPYLGVKNIGSAARLTLSQSTDKERAQLRALIEREIDETEYTPESIEAYKAALPNARLLLESENATRGQLQAAIDVLSNLLVKSTLTVDTARAKLKELIAREIDETLYTPESVATYKMMAAAARMTADDPEATLEQPTRCWCCSGRPN